MDDRYKAIMEDLEAVCKKHNIELGACGDCGSMWIDDATTGETLYSSILSVSADNYTEDTLSTRPVVLDLGDPLEGVPPEKRPL